MPDGLKSATLYITHVSSGRVFISTHFGTDDGGGDGSRVIRPTVYYPITGTWRVDVFGDLSYYGLNFKIVGYPDPYPLSRQAGSFSALLNGTDRVVITLGATHVFSGRLYRPGASFAFRGVFDAAGNASSISPVPYSLHINPVFNPVPGANNIGGTVAGESFTAYHAAYSSTHLAPELGRYNTLLKPNASGPTLPGGTGYGVLRVGRTGAVTLVGKLADGTGLSAGGPLYGSASGQPQFLLYDAAIHAAKGLLTGPMTFQSAAASSADGVVRWIKPTNTAAYYPAAFDTTLSTISERYGARAKGLMALDFPARDQNATITVSGGGVADFSETATLAGTNVVTIIGANPHGLKLTFNAAAGAFTGSFIHPLTNKANAFAGTLYQNASAPEAAGYFRGPLQMGHGITGDVVMTPR
ncbi:MAG TPA: hypothetical protein VGO11_13780 [Chthoniobacteraceae bacterium]|nr:hypothetical protein [Chthoniobacteraceae bacterium]